MNTALVEQLKRLMTTQEDLNSLILILDSLIENSYKPKDFLLEDSFPKFPLSGWQKELYQSLDSEMKSGGLSAFRTSCETLRDSFNNFEMVRVVLPFKPSDSFETRLHETISRHLSKPFLLSITQGTENDSGARVFVGGNFLDLSLRPQIVKFLKDKYVI